jgi:SAM-dependent methyltransferase
VVVASAYDGLAAGWDGGAGVVYRPLASSLLQASPVALSGRRVLDVGSGTGAVSEAARAVGARVVPADLTFEMVAHMHTRGWPAVAGDVLALPFGRGVFDAALAGFLLNHLPPRPALAELARTVRVGGVVLGTTWDGSSADPVKEAIDAVLLAHGWVWPEWYETLKAELEPVTGDPQRLKEAAEDVGLVEVGATVCRQDLRVQDPAAAVGYRLALPHIAPWAAGLDRSEQVELRRAASRAATPHLAAWRPAAIILSGRVDVHPK